MVLGLLPTVLYNSTLKIALLSFFAVHYQTAKLRNMQTMTDNDIQWYRMIYNDIEWYTMIYHDIPWYTMIYHDIQKKHAVFKTTSGDQRYIAEAVQELPQQKVPWQSSLGHMVGLQNWQGQRQWNHVNLVQMETISQKTCPNFKLLYVQCIFQLASLKKPPCTAGGIWNTPCLIRISIEIEPIRYTTVFNLIYKIPILFVGKTNI